MSKTDFNVENIMKDVERRERECKNDRQNFDDMNDIRDEITGQMKLF